MIGSKFTIVNQLASKVTSYKNSYLQFRIKKQFSQQMVLAHQNTFRSNNNDQLTTSETSKECTKVMLLLYKMRVALVLLSNTRLKMLQFTSKAMKL